MTDVSRDAGYFERMYAADPDPWRFRTSAYEAEKYAATVAAIAGRRYRAGLEVGCSIGVLSAQVAPLCDAFLGLDIAEAPLAEARARCAGLAGAKLGEAGRGGARFACMAVPGAWPAGLFDLILLSEVLYFLSAADVRAVAARVRACLMPGGRVLLVNWIGEPAPPQPGDGAAEAFIAAAELPVERAERAALYRLDLLARRG
jgi:cyclopropane fatty-acyl-phospholipid synthase-like methyltransferase